MSASVSHWRSLPPLFTTEAQSDVRSRGGGKGVLVGSTDGVTQHRYKKHISYSPPVVYSLISLMLYSNKNRNS